MSTLPSVSAPLSFSALLRHPIHNPLQQQITLFRNNFSHASRVSRPHTSNPTTAASVSSRRSHFPNIYNPLDTTGLIRAQIERKVLRDLASTYRQSVENSRGFLDGKLGLLAIGEVNERGEMSVESAQYVRWWGVERAPWGMYEGDWRMA